MKSEFNDGNDYPGGAERALLPTHLGGYQHLEPEVIIQAGDILVENGRPQGFVDGFIDKPVRAAEDYTGYNVYRLMPVAKQADSHEREFAATASGAILPGSCAPDLSGSLAIRLPSDAKARKGIPLYSGLLAYFPDALCAVAELSRIGNDQHNPGKPLHWDRSKSGDEADALMRHLLQCDEVDKDGVLHAVKVAWRGLALAQKKLEAARGHP